jgi:hypothetical protein
MKAVIILTQTIVLAPCFLFDAEFNWAACGCLICFSLCVIILAIKEYR